MSNGSPYGMGHSSGVAGFFRMVARGAIRSRRGEMRQAFHSHTVGATVREVATSRSSSNASLAAAGKVLPADPPQGVRLKRKVHVVPATDEDGALRRERRLPSASRGRMFETCIEPADGVGNALHGRGSLSRTPPLPVKTTLPAKSLSPRRSRPVRPWTPSSSACARPTASN